MDSKVLSILLVPILFILSCQSVSVLFDGGNDYRSIFLNINQYDIANIHVKENDFIQIMYLSKGQSRTFIGASAKLPTRGVIYWEVKSRGGKKHAKFTLPDSVSKKFVGTIAFCFNNDSVTVEWAENNYYEDRTLANKYHDMSKAFRASQLASPYIKTNEQSRQE